MKNAREVANLGERLILSITPKVDLMSSRSIGPGRWGILLMFVEGLNV